MEYIFHEIANILPMMDEESFAGLKKDISENGLIEPIWLHDNQIIDGRNRYCACLETGVTPTFREWPGVGSLTQFVISLNLNRRHLTFEQRVVIALEMEPRMAAEAKARQVQAGKEHGRGIEKVIPDSAQPITTGTAIEQAAKLMCLGKTSVGVAKKIARDAPERFQDIKDGKATLNQVDMELRKPRAKKEEAKAAPHQCASALTYATSALSHLSQIQDDDPDRVEAFTEVFDYCNNQLREKKSKFVMKCVAAGLPKGATHQIAALYGSGSAANKAIRKFPEYEYTDKEKCQTANGRLLSMLENRLKGHYQKYRDNAIDQI